ncbi:hypothetical protein T03_1571 [Trichinella britovi]|uniref:Uncharacterized protein n=1 Tax=Trichinella britovi TaxID=45882 RepID=A0A0V1D5M6_TRIBR|nr:hypothetical protein T03_1571 [Trichinella britovi]
MLNGRCATAAQAECLLEVWKRTDATPAADGCAEDNGESISSVLNQSNRESRIERSAGVIRERAVNVKWSACDQRAVPCKLIPFVAESVLRLQFFRICDLRIDCGSGQQCQERSTTFPPRKLITLKKRLQFFMEELE